MSPQSSRKLETALALVVITVLFALLMKFVILVEDEVRPAPPQVFGALPVETRTVVAGVALPGLPVKGTLEARRRATIAAEVSGRVVRVFDGWGPGRPVAAGTELFALDAGPAQLALATASAQLAEAEARVASARVDLEAAEQSLPNLDAALEVATRLRQRLEKLLKTGETSASMVDNALVQEKQAAVALQSGRSAIERARAGLKAGQAGVASAQALRAQAADAVGRHVFLAPFDGLLMGNGPALGDLLLPASPVGELVDPARVVFVAQVHESDLGRVQVGLGVDVELPALAGQVLRGVVASRAPIADPLTRNVAFDVRIAGGADDAAFASLPAGLFARGVVDPPGGGALPDALHIARGEFVWSRGAALAFVARPGPEGLAAVPTALKLGAEVGEGFLVLSGLAAGDELVVAPLDRLAIERATAIQRKEPEAR